MSTLIKLKKTQFEIYYKKYNFYIGITKDNGLYMHLIIKNNIYYENLLFNFKFLNIFNSLNTLIDKLCLFITKNKVDYKFNIDNSIFIFNIKDKTLFKDCYFELYLRNDTDKSKITNIEVLNNINKINKDYILNIELNPILNLNYKNINNVINF